MSPIVREYFRVPRQDRAVYLRPALSELPALVEANRRLIASYDFELAGRPFAEFRAAARAEIVSLARAWTGERGFTVPEWAEPAPLVFTGHQPLPFHPGVWFKNFLAGSLAAAVGGVALNLIVDNDEAHGQTLRFPVRGGESQGHEWEAAGWLVDDATWPGKDIPQGEVRALEMPLAHPAAGVAFEEQPVAVFSEQQSAAGSGEPRSLVLGGLPRVPNAEDIADLDPSQIRWMDIRTAHAIRDEILKVLSARLLMALPLPLSDAFHRWFEVWVPALYVAETHGEAMTVARRRLEEELDLRNLELPVSRLADGNAFRLFVAEMLARREDLFAAHNASLAEYRRVYRERSAAQPVPDLGRDGRRMELPFWAWRAGEARRRLWVEAAANGRVVLLADREPIGTLGESEIADATAAAARLARFREAGWKVRPRALSLTLFTHLCLGDVFVHGLGGALYDKVTDVVFERFLGIRAPGIILATCTVHLPLEAYPSTRADLEKARRAVRDWRFNPDRMMSEAAVSRPEARTLIAEKWRLIRDRAPTRDGRSRAYHRVHAVNQALAGLEPDGPPAAEATLARVERELRWNAILRNREYAFWFYPAQDLAAFYRKVTAI